MPRCLGLRQLRPPRGGVKLSRTSPSATLDNAGAIWFRTSETFCRRGTNPTFCGLSDMTAQYRLTEAERVYHKIKKRESRARIAKIRTPEETKAINKAQYEKHKERYKAKARAWNQENRTHQQAMVHQAQVRKRYPATFAASSITTAALKEWLDVRRGCTCPYCGVLDSTHIDHIVPLSKGGLHCFDNLQIICKDCNVSKLDRSEEEFFAWVRRIGELIRLETV